MRTPNLIKSGLLVLGTVFAALSPTAIWADGGASSGESGACRIEVGPHLVHFTAYQPQLTGTAEYCSEIPETGNASIVFDYEGKALRHMTVEFEITKQPEGTRIFYKAPSTHPTGTFNTDVNFTMPGDYVAHVTLVNEGQTIDSHIPFKVGAHGGVSLSTYIVIGAVLMAIGYILYLSNPAFKAAVDRVTQRKVA